MTGTKFLLLLRAFMRWTGTSLHYTFNAIAYNTRPNDAAESSNMRRIQRVMN